MAKKFSLVDKFIHDLDGKNTIIRKSDGFKWRVVVCQFHIEYEHGWMPLIDKNLSQFFDENNNFRFNEYDLLYVDYFKEFAMNEAKQHGKEWTKHLNFNDTTEQVLRDIFCTL